MANHPYRVLLTDADRFPPSEADRAVLEDIGAELIEVSYGIEEKELAHVCKDIDAVLVFAAKITLAVIEKMTRCKIIARCGIGFDNIDVEAAKKRGITITYVPDFCVEEVSDHTVGLMLDCWRKISYSNDRIRKGYWDTYKSLGKMRRITGQTVGFLGLGRIAQEVARKLRGFNLRLIAFDPYVPPSAMQTLGVASVSFNELIRVADVLSLHLPLTAETQHIINKKVLEQMKFGATLINTSRGPLVDETALIHALHNGRIGAAGLDVLELEPPNNDNLLLEMEQVVITPHSAAFSEEALSEVRQRAIAEVVRKFKGLQPQTPVPVTTYDKTI